MAPLPPLRDGGCALPICPFGRACLPLISDAPDCKCSPGRLRFWVVWASCPGAAAPISIHAPRGGAAIGDLADLTTEAFQSTRPVWGATARRGRCCRETSNFNPRAPCGARQRMISLSREICTFQSTRPVWGATRGRGTQLRRGHISIHAPRVGRDFRGDIRPGWLGMISIHAPRVGRDGFRYSVKILFCHFNPRAPCGARRKQA